MSNSNKSGKNFRASFLLVVLALFTLSPLVAQNDWIEVTYLDDWTLYASFPMKSTTLTMADQNGGGRQATYDEQGRVIRIKKLGKGDTAYIELSYEKGKFPTKVDFFIFDEDTKKPINTFSYLYAYNAKGQLSGYSTKYSYDGSTNEAVVKIDGKGNYSVTTGSGDEGGVGTTVSVLNPQLRLLEETYSYQQNGKKKVDFYKYTHTYDASGVRVKSNYLKFPNPQINKKRSGVLSYSVGLDKNKVPVSFKSTISQDDNFLEGEDYAGDFLEASYQIKTSTGKVELNSDTIKVKKLSLPPGADIELSFTIPKGKESNLNWVGIYAKGDEPSEENEAIDWVYVNSNSQEPDSTKPMKGSLKMKTDLEPGKYVAWLFFDDEYEAIGKAEFTVK